MKDRKTIVRLPALLIVIFLVFSACTKKAALKAEPSAPVPENVTEETLIERIDFSGINTFSASVKLGIRKKDESRGVFSGVLLYSHPDRLSVRIFGPLGLTVIETLFDRGALQVFIPPKDTVYSGKIPLYRLLPDNSSLLSSMRFVEETDDMYVLYIIGSSGGPTAGNGSFNLNAKYFFDKATLAWKALELYSDGKKQVRIEVYKTEGKIPADIGVYVRDVFFHLELDDISLNKAFKKDYFQPLEASQSLPLSRFLRNLEPSQ